MAHLPPPLGPKALLRLQRRNAFIQRYRDRRDKECETDVVLQHCPPDYTTDKTATGNTAPAIPITRRNKNHGNSSVGEKSNRGGACSEGKVQETSAINKETISNLELSNSSATHVRLNVEGVALKGVGNKEMGLLKTAFAAKDDEVVVFFPQNNVPLNGSSFRRLRDNNWLNDELVNGYVGMINSREEYIRTKRTTVKYRNIPRTYMFSSFLFSKIKKDKTALTENGVLKWTKKARMDVLTYDLLLVPLHLNGNHWALCSIDLIHREFTYIDSLYEKDTNKVIASLKKWLHAEIHIKKGKTTAEDYNISLWTERRNCYRARSVQNQTPLNVSSSNVLHDTFNSTPKQNDGSSCCVFMLQFSDCLSMGKPILFKQEDIKFLRTKIALECIRRSLPCP